MTIVWRSLAVLLSILFIAPSAGAQDRQGHVIQRAALDRAIQERVIQEKTDRDAIVSLLRRSEVRQLAARAGLSVEKVEAAVSTLQGDDLREIARQARHVQDDLSGGASTITISTTTIIIVLLIIILIVVIAD